MGLARQRAVDEAANRMGEIVMDTVERVIGREVNAEAHHDLIDEAVRALRADASGGAAAVRGAPVNPTLQGYAAAVLEAAGPGGLAGLAGDLEAIDNLVNANATLRSALTDTTVRGASPPGRHARSARRQGVRAGAPPGRVRRLRRRRTRRAGCAELGGRPAPATPPRDSSTTRRP